MWLLLIGLAVAGAKLAEFGPMAHWDWWVVAIPFAAAAAWWHFSDSIGLTKQRAMDREDAKREERRQRQLQSLGIEAKRDRRAQRAVAADRAAARAAAPVAATPPARDPTQDSRI